MFSVFIPIHIAAMSVRIPYFHPDIIVIPFLLETDARLILIRTPGEQFLGYLGADIHDTPINHIISHILIPLDEKRSMDHTVLSYPHIKKWLRDGCELLQYDHNHFYVRERLSSFSKVPYYRIWNIRDCNNPKAFIMRESLCFEDIESKEDPLWLEQSGKLIPMRVPLGDYLRVNGASVSLLVALDTHHSLSVRFYDIANLSAAVEQASVNAHIYVEELEKLFKTTPITELTKYPHFFFP